MRKSYRNQIWLRSCLWVASVALPAGAASAQALDDKAWIQAGLYLPGVDSDFRLDPDSASEGSILDFETDLNLEDRKTLPIISAGLRLGKRWRLGLDYYSLSREGEVSLARDILVGDVTYPAAATVRSGLSSDIYRLTVGYSFVRKSNWDVGVALGAHVTDFAVFVEGNGRVGAQAASAQVRRRELLAPLPTIGLYATHQVAKGLTVSARTDFLSLKVGDYKGNLLNAQAGLTYRFTKNFGVGAMYRFVRYRLKVERDDWIGRLGYRFSGPALYVELGF